jgi:hypothetical protein
MYQSLYESDVRFEHCYRIDEERQLPITDKLQCWQDWSRRYRYGQSRDRIGYAQARERTLAQALAAGQQAAPRGAVGASMRSSPQPINAYALPPQTLTPASASINAAGGGASRATNEIAVTDAGTTAEASSLAGSSSETTPVGAPGASCTGTCTKTWTSCKQPCKASPCRSECDDRYRGCMRACF